MNRRTRLQAVKQEPLFLLLLALGVLFFSLNLYRLAYQSLWLDECFNVLAAKQILTFGYPLYPSGHIYFKALLCSYVFAFFAALFGDTVIVFRLVSLLLYLLLPLCVYWLAKGIFHRFVLFACGLVLYLHAWEIEFARTALYYTLLQYMVTLGVLLFMARELFGRRSRYRLQWLLTGLTHQLGMALGFCFPALLVLRPRAIRRKGLLISVAVFVPFFLFVMFQEPLIWQVGHAAPVQQADGAGGVLHFFFGSFSFAYFHMLYRSHPVAATVFAAGALLLLFGLAVRLLRRLPEPNAQLLGLAFISLLLVFILLGLGFIKTHEKPRYLFAFHPIFILAVVGLLWQGLSWAAARLTRKFQPLLLALICLLALLAVDQTGPGQLWRIMHRDYDEPVQTDVITTSDRPYPIDHQRLGEYVHAQREPGDVIIAVHMLFQHHYAGRVDYWLWTGGPGTWDAWEEKDGRLRDTYLGVPMLHDVSALKAAINRHLKQGDRVWLITSPSEYNREHINWPVMAFLVGNRDKIRWISRDHIGKVYLFSREYTPFPTGLYEAEWGIYPARKAVQRTDGALVRIDDSYVYRTSLFARGPAELELLLIFAEPSSDSLLSLAVYREGVLESRLSFQITSARIPLHIPLKNKGRYSLRMRLIAGPAVRLDGIDQPAYRQAKP